jgi:dihydropteroate synthase
VLLRARQFEFEFPRPAMLMGIVNVTPDSFSDGGHFLAVPRAIQRALELVAEGADIIDIGGESTRPGAREVSEKVELRRVLPVIRELTETSKVSVPISIDTMKPAVALAALEAGASIINDVAANSQAGTPVPNFVAPATKFGTGNYAMWDIVRETNAAYVLMHMQGTPQTMQRDPRYENVTRDVSKFYDERLIRLRECGVSSEQIILDPGIGFGKTCEHNLELLAGLGHLRTYQRPVMVGASRKGFIGQVTGAKESAERLPGSLACACAAVQAGAQIIRTHDVAATRQALRMTEAIQARQK